VATPEATIDPMNEGYCCDVEVAGPRYRYDSLGASFVSCRMTLPLAPSETYRLIVELDSFLTVMDIVDDPPALRFALAQAAVARRRRQASMRVIMRQAPFRVSK
jgi:hypothetical protein